MKRRESGNMGEKAAVKFLKKNGYRIRGTNFRCRTGEIDIIAEKNDWLVFIEVRTKTNLEFGKPEESVTTAKKERLINTALTYLANYKNLPSLWRIDFVAVEMDKQGKIRRIELIENAVS